MNAFRRCVRLPAVFLAFSLVLSVERASRAADASTVDALVELLVSARPDDEASGECELSARRDEIIGFLIERLRSSRTGEAGEAAAHLGLVISPWLRTVEAGVRFHLCAPLVDHERPIERAAKIKEAAELRTALRNRLSALLANLTPAQSGNYQMRDAIYALCETLTEVADDDAIDFLVEWLPYVEHRRFAEILLQSIESYAGLPRTFERRYFCGGVGTLGGVAANSRPTEDERFAAACQRLAAEWRKIRSMRPSERLSYSIRRWREKFVPGFGNYCGLYFLQGTGFRRLEPIIRLGKPALPLLRAQQARESSLEMKARWEVIIAAISGNADEKMLRKLLARRGGAYLTLTCEIIGASGSSKWLQELRRIRLAGRSLGPTATLAIARCHGYAAIPVLREAADLESMHYAAHAVRELEQLARGEAAKERQRYRLFAMKEL